jgi:hypothetical protein
LLFVGRAEDFPILLAEWLPMFGVNRLDPNKSFLLCLLKGMLVYHQSTNVYLVIANAISSFDELNKLACLQKSSKIYLIMGTLNKH